LEYTHSNKLLNLISGGIQNQFLLLLSSFERMKNLKISIITKYTEYKPSSNKISIKQLHRFKYYKLDTIYFILKSFFSLIRIHKKERIDVIYLSGHDNHVDNHVISPFLFRLIFKTPIIMKMPTDYTNYIRIVYLTEKQNFMAKIINYSWFKFYKRVILKKINFMRTINQKMYIDLLDLKYPKDRILALPNGIDSEKFITFGKNIQNNTHFGFVGRLTKIKNLKFMLEVFKKYFHEFTNDKLLIYGEGPEEAIISTFIDKNKISNNIHLMGFERNKEKIYPNLDVLINSSYGEGMSNVILEAMATKTFIIASNVQGNTDLIKHGVTGLLYKLNSEKALLKQLIYYKQNKILIKQILENGINQIKQNYDIEVIATKLYNFLKSKI